MEIQKLVPANTNRNSATPTSASAISKQYAHSAAVSKIGAKEMLRVYSQHSELLRKIKVLEPFALPDNYSYVDKSSSKLAENEKSLTKPLPLKSPPTYRWKEIRVISVTETNNSTFSSRTPRKSNDTSKIADDSGFSELVDSDYPLASSSTMKTNLGITKTAELKKTKQSSVSTTNQRASYPKKSSAKKDSIEKCPICGERFPLCIIQVHAAECGNDDFELFEVTPPKQTSQRPARLAKSKAKKRIFRELKRECESNSLTGHRTALEDAKAAGEQVFLDVEKLDDDVIMIENGAPSSSQNKKRRGQH